MKQNQKQRREQRQRSQCETTLFGSNFILLPSKNWKKVNFKVCDSSKHYTCVYAWVPVKQEKSYVETKNIIRYVKASNMRPANIILNLNLNLKLRPRAVTILIDITQTTIHGRHGRILLLSHN